MKQRKPRIEKKNKAAWLGLMPQGCDE